MYTATFHPGDKIRLVDFGCAIPAFRRRLLALGITRGVEIVVIRKAPLGCPIEIEVRGTRLALRKKELAYLQWELL